MRTLSALVLILTLTGLLLAQTDSTLSDTTTIPAPVVEMPLNDTTIATSTDSLVLQTTDLELAIPDSAVIDNGLVSTTDSLTAPDSLALTDEPEMAWTPRVPEPLKISGLMNQGPLYYWSNDGLAGLGLDSLSYVTLEDPSLIAIKAADCMDIVCHLLATDSTGVQYVVVVPEDSADYQIYDTATKVVILEAPAADLAAAFDAYIKDLTGMEYIAVAPDATPFIGPVLPAEDLTATVSDNGRQASQKIKRRQFRSMAALFGNPANLGRDFDSFTAWNLLPNLSIGVHNSLLTPGWYKQWLTEGGVWDEATKAEYLSTITNQQLALTITPEFQSLFGFRIGHFGLNIGGGSHIKITIPGNTLGLPMRDILLDQPVKNGGLDIEVIPFVAKTSLSYAQPIHTPVGNLIVGVNVNTFEAAGLLKMSSDDLNITMTTDSILVTASGESWATKAGINGHLDDPNLDNLDAASTVSSPSFGVDLGIIMDLEPLVHQELEVQAALRNLGAKYEWTGVTHESWTFEQAMPAPGSADTDSLEQYQTNESVLMGEDETYTMDLPTVLDLAVTYQPISQVLIGAGIEQAFTDQDILGYSSGLSLNYQLNLYPVPWFDLSYYKQARYGEPVHTFGTGLHFGFLDTGLTLSFFNGLNTDAKGIGFGLRSSLHF